MNEFGSWITQSLCGGKIGDVHRVELQSEPVRSLVYEIKVSPEWEKRNAERAANMEALRQSIDDHFASEETQRRIRGYLDDVIAAEKKWGFTMEHNVNNDYEISTELVDTTLPDASVGHCYQPFAIQAWAIDHPYFKRGDA